MKAAEAKYTPFPNSHNNGQPFFQKTVEAAFFSDRQTDIQTNPFFSKQAATPFIQTKLTIGQPGDKYEQEADAVADRVVQRLSNPETVQTKPMPLASTLTPLVQPKCAGCEEEDQVQKKEEDEDRLEHGIQRKPVSESGEPPPDKDIQRKCAECEAEDKLQRKGEDNAVETGSSSSLESRLHSSRGSGSPLPKGTRTQMESSFGAADFSNVRIHTGSSAVQMNNDLHAQAFTHGSDIYFNSGKYNSENTSGNHLLAHELTHVVQQKGVKGNIQKADSSESGVKEHGDLSQIPPDMVDCPHATTSPANEGTVNYPISSPELSPSVRTSLIVFVDSWRSSGANAHIRIDGYASVDGTEAYNWRLSCNRAKALKEELVFQGINSSYIEIYAHGETNRFSASSYEPNRVATLASTLPPPVPPTPEPDPKPEPVEKNMCGPDITASLGGVLSKVDHHFHGLSWWEKRRSCGALDVDAPLVFVNPIMAWDVRQLFLPSTWWLDSYFITSGCGSPRNPGCDTDPQRHLCEEAGTCGNTVVVGGKCMLAGTANYAIYGRMFKLCNDEFWPDFPRWDMRAMINLYKAISFFAYDDPEPPREMATAVFDGTFPAIPASVENRAHCKGRCGKTHSGSFGFVWEPYKPR